MELARGANTIRPGLFRSVGRSNPLRILHLIETGGPGGAERMLLTHARHLATGYQSMIGLLKPGWLQSQAQLQEIPHTLLSRNGQVDLSVLTNLIRIVRQQKIELIHAHEFYMSLMGALASRMTGTPLVVTVHGKSYYPDKMRRRVLYRFVAARASGLVAVSEDLRRFFCETIRIPPTRMNVIYNGIDLQPLSISHWDSNPIEQLGIPPYATVIGAVGNLYPVKGHVHLIRAASRVLQQKQNIHVVILGRGPLRDALRQEAESLGIGDRIHLVGFCDDVPNWLSAMDIFALPSLSEGLPLSLLEALAAGKPVVVTNVGGIPEVVRNGETGVVVPPADSDALAKQLVDLLDNPAKATAMGEAGQQLVRERFSVARMTAEYSSMYEAAVAH